MFESVLIALMAITWLAGGLSLLVLIHACFKGRDYIALSNVEFRYSDLKLLFGGRIMLLWFFRMTPFAMMIVGGWAGFAVIYDLAWPLGGVGYFNRETGEWTTYRIGLASSVGATLGVFFGWWVTRLCEKNCKKDPDNAEKSRLELLAEVI